MPPQLALLVTTIFVYFAFRSDRKRDIGDTSGLFWPSLWYVVVATRPIGVWFSIWGLPLPGGGDDPTEGSLVDRVFFGVLTIIGLKILSKRKFKWGPVLSYNAALTAFVVFMAVSILWSQYPFVSFKRYIKVLGSIVMAMVVLTQERPFSAMCTVIRRCLYIHLPMSILCTRYYRNIGVSFEWGGTAETWEGISTSKNTLGQVTAIAVLYFFWEVRRHWAAVKWKNLHLLYLLMGLYLLKGSEKAVSMTSVSVAAFSLAVFLRLLALRAKPEAARRFATIVFTGVATVVIFVVVHSLVMFSEDSIPGEIIKLLGRDVTLTDRTYIWHDVYAAAATNPLVGVGFGGFWIGRMANIPWNSTMTWVLGQAHSGYVDNYLQLGLVGSVFLAVVLISSHKRLLRSMDDDYEFACFRITLFVTIVFINMTESVYLRGDHHLWLILMMAIWVVPSPQVPFVARTQPLSVPTTHDV